MAIRSLGVIGSGAIAAPMLEALARHIGEPIERLSVLTLAEAELAAKALVDRCGGRIARRCNVVTDAEAFLAEQFDFVVECAGHGAVKAYGAKVLSRGIDLLVVSIGALTDDGLREQLGSAARAAGSRLVLCSGAIGGIDLLAAASLSGIERITYTSRKPPRAWRGTPAEKLIDLDAVTTETVFYEGTARAAARDYPQNANSAATIAIASVGLDRASVRLIADPAAPGNVHEFKLQSACADMEVRIVGKPSPDNPKTSMSTAYTVAREILNRIAPVAI
jgi:aspartate dehydrogenase